MSKAKSTPSSVYDDLPLSAIYILGAGFSVEAGLPLANDLWPEVCKRVLRMSGRAEKFREDLDDYIEFRSRTDGRQLTHANVDFEEFLGFLDIEHHLGLRGSETWSSDGNESQVIVKTLIAQVLTERMPLQIPEIYLQFADQLKPYDTVITFNYDTLLERACDQVGKPYRLAPHRFVSICGGSGAVDTAPESEIVILKVHGSIDWFDKKRFQKRIEAGRRPGYSDYVPDDPIFNTQPPLEASPLVSGPRMPDDPLNETYRIHDIERVYARPPLFIATPTLITPSTSKVVYASHLADYWSGMRYQGGMNARMVVIGYSLPPHDEYARQVIYRLVTNYQSCTQRKKEPLTIVDFCPAKKNARSLRKRYSFVEWKKCRRFLSGFNGDVIEALNHDMRA